LVLVWIGFVVFILACLALDLGVFQRRAHTIETREALIRSALWMSLGLSFGIFVYYAYELQWFGLGVEVDSVDGEVNDGNMALAKYLTGYIIEQSLSVDNIFVMVTIFAYFGVVPEYQPRVLQWGIVGAMALRGIMIAVGASLIYRFHWILYLFGAFLIVTGVRMLFVKGEATDLDRNPLVRWVRRWIPVTAQFHGGHFVVRAGSSDALEPPAPGHHCKRDAVVEGATRGALLLTPLGLALVVIELSDLIFAIDSIPAIFAITADPFLVFTSNVFAILGLRSLYFALAGLIDRFRYLNISLALVLVVVGAKMLASSWLKATFGSRANVYLLGTIVAILALGIAASWFASRLERPPPSNVAKRRDRKAG
jgi:tellurite resistance protein TerC